MTPSDLMNRIVPPWRAMMLGRGMTAERFDALLQRNRSAVERELGMLLRTIQPVSAPVVATPKPKKARPVERSDFRKVPAAALEVLRRATIGPDYVQLEDVQLDRPVYEEAAKILETVGAKWNRSRKVHVFTETWDRGMFEDILETGEAPPENPLAFFATPRVVADEMMRQSEIQEAWRFGETVVLEPSAGTGNFALAAAQAWATWAANWSDQDNLTLRVVMVELDERRVRILSQTVKERIKQVSPSRIFVDVIHGDFMDMSREQLRNPNIVVMNPPFSVPGDDTAWWTHLQHAIDVVSRRGAVACIIPPKFRYATRSGMLEALALVSRGTAWPIPEKAFSASGTNIGTWALVISKEEAEKIPTTDAAEIVIVNTRETYDQIRDAYRRQIRAGEPDHGDRTSSWGRTIEAVVKAVALGEADGQRHKHDQQTNGDAVSFSPKFLAAISRELWQRFSEE